MDEVLGPMKWKTAAVFIDDICIFSKTFWEHMDHLWELFNRLREANLKLNPKKSHFMCQQVNLLGHTVSAEGIAPDQDKLQLIRNAPQPENLKKLRSFMGLAGYYR